ncbi:MAG: type II toxin-antitoxin system PemK/MazF family toxin [Candidatus Hydrothermarchaeota archaeon]
MTKDSVLLCEQIRVIDRKRLVRKLGNIGEENLQKVGVRLKVILGLE